MRTAERLRLNGSVRFDVPARHIGSVAWSHSSVRSNMQRPSGGTAQPSALLFCEASEDDGGVMCGPSGWVDQNGSTNARSKSSAPS